MSETETDIELGSEERDRIVKDISRWKYELEMGNEFSGEDLQEYIAMLQEMSDRELKAHWKSTVGEWVASRNDVHPPEDTEFENWLTTQFENLIAGKRTAYGFVVELSPSATEPAHV